MKGTIVDITNVSFLAVVGSPALKGRVWENQKGGLQGEFFQPPLLTSKANPMDCMDDFPTHQMRLLPKERACFYKNSLCML